MPLPKLLLRVPVSLGKYVVIQEADGRIKALRDGQEWRSFAGDNLTLGNLVLGLAQDLDSERNMVKELGEAMEVASRFIGKPTETASCHFGMCSMAQCGRCGRAKQFYDTYEKFKTHKANERHH